MIRGETIQFMPAGPLRGQPLVVNKRSVSALSVEQLPNQCQQIFANCDSIVENYRYAGQWWYLGFCERNISRIELLQQINWNRREHIHLLIRVIFSQPAAIARVRTDGRVVFDTTNDMILTITPHEAVGENTSGRRNDVHTVAYRALATKKFLKSMRRSPQAHFFATELTLDQWQRRRVVANFLAASAANAGQIMFNYHEQNCSSLLWQTIIPALGNRLSSPSDETRIQTLVQRGRFATETARVLGLQPRPSYFFADPSEWQVETIAAIRNYIEFNTPENQPASRNIEVRVAPKRNPVLQAIYRHNLVDHQWLPYFLGDKLLMAQLIRGYLKNSNYAKIQPKAVGVIDFLKQNQLVDSVSGRATIDEARLRVALLQTFPNGFVVKKTMDHGSDRGNIFCEEEFIADLLSAHPQTYRQQHWRQPLSGDQFGSPAPASGERYFLMEKIAGTRLSSADGEAGERSEYRLHSFARDVLPTATQNRWDHFTDRGEVQSSNLLLAEMLNALPLGLTWRQAYSFDVALQPSGGFRLIEVNTNRGRPKFWSDFLRDPQVLAAHVQLFEQQYGWQFLGESGELLRSGLGNITNHIVNDVLYFEEKVNTAPFNREFVLDYLKRQNVALLEQAKNYSGSEPQTAAYLNELREFADGYVARVSELGSLSGNSWRQLCRWTSENYLAISS